MKINLKSVRILSKKNIKNHLIEETDQEQIVVLRAKTLRLGLSEYHLPYHGIKFNIDGYLLDTEVQKTLSVPKLAFFSSCLLSKQPNGK